MPTLTYTNNNQPLGGLLTGRVLIGRRLSHGVVFNDPSVSRLHAWIDPEVDPEDDTKLGWLITDAGSKTGTFVNERQVVSHTLRDGDEIRVGTATLQFHAHNAMSAGITSVELTSPTGVVKTSGILFECSCGAPLWVGNELAGKRGLCRHCRKTVTVPALPEKVAPAPVTTPPPEPAATVPRKRQAKCAVCHSDIADSEEITTCPDCAVTFHTECWQENLGCSTYGCPQVNALRPKTAVDHAVETKHPQQDFTETEGPPVAWDLILLAASVVGSLLGSLAFGSVAAVVGLIAVIMLIRGKQRRPGLLVAAILLSIIGVAGGLAVSDFWYFHAKHLPDGLHEWLHGLIRNRT